MPPFRDEHILIIVPGSQTTLAQLGLPESFCPAQHRFPTRMFPAPDGKTFEPYKVRSRKKAVVAYRVDVDMADTTDPNLDGDDTEELLEDPEDDEGAIYPLKGTHLRRVYVNSIDMLLRGSNRQHACLLRFPQPHLHHPVADVAHARYVDRTACLDGKEP